MNAPMAFKGNVTNGTKLEPHNFLMFLFFHRCTVESGETSCSRRVQRTRIQTKGNLFTILFHLALNHFYIRH